MALCNILLSFGNTDFAISKYLLKKVEEQSPNGALKIIKSYFFVTLSNRSETKKLISQLFFLALLEAHSIALGFMSDPSQLYPFFTR